MNLIQANVVELAPAAARTATLTGTAIDIRKYDGVAQIILMCEAASAGTTPTLNVKVQHADTSGGSYTDISGAAFTEVTDAADLTEMIALNVSEVKPFIKVIGTIGGTSSPAFAYGVAMVATCKAGRNESQSI